MDHSTMMSAGVRPDVDHVQLARMLSFVVLPLLALAASMVARLAGRAHLFRGLPLTVRLAILGMLSTAGVHLALVPEHLTESPLLGVSFLLAAVALVALAAAALTRARYWEVATVAVIGVMVIGYAYTRVAGIERWDLAGLLTKAIELATLLLLLPRLSSLRLRLATAGAGSGA